MNIDLATLPTLPLAQRAALPDAPGIYFALAADGTVLYIGKARRLVARWNSTQHHRYAQLAAMPGVRLAWLVVSDVALLRSIEQACIEYFNPPLNSTPKEGNRRGRISFQLVIPAEVLVAVRELANAENRSISNMLATLVTEAIKARKEKKSGPFLPALRTQVEQAA